MGIKSILSFLVIFISIVSFDRCEEVCDAGEGCGPRDDCDSLLNDNPLYGFDSFNGKYYVKGELVYSLPFKSSGSLIKQSIIDTIKRRLPEIDTIGLYSNSTLDTCICGQNIWLFRDTTKIIGKETDLAQNNTTESEKEGGGGILSLNYIFEQDKPTIPKEITTYINNPNNIPDNSNNIPDNYVNRTNNSVKLAFIDSGVFPKYILEESLYPTVKNPENCENIVAFGWDFVNSDSIPHDDDGHGFVVHASFIHSMLRECNNLNPLIDLNKEYNPYNIQQLFIKTLDECGYGTSFDNACGIHYARIHDVDYINCSWGFYGEDPQIERAILEAVDDQIKIITSSGNKGEDLFGYPKRHLPSGYGEDESISSFHRYVYEVEGACIDPLSFFQTENPETIKIWQHSNFRTNNLIHQNRRFVEPSIGFETLLPFISIEEGCSINGTSFAAPFALGSLIRNFQNQEFRKDEFYDESLIVNRADFPTFLYENSYSLSYFQCSTLPIDVPGQQ